MRIFRASPETAESVRAALDAAWGYPNPQVVTETAFRPADKLPRDAQGRVYLRISERYCDYEPIASMLPSLLENGVEELTQAEYLAVFPPRQPRR